eukprot:CAMPEP_0171089762 /NCGR_PEP_ID=MMETSP0766_2-20121228/27322_1 /TAXON_ID=439317 /ORGANISM="Gambierdiscus australes, Strain CAWD 149" /LENGTH=193 /DNA_ID=CAMNT_0011547669 /DNA_START=63 /DNA_END=642 /DNA_ORIENTATION=-
MTGLSFLLVPCCYLLGTVSAHAGFDDAAALLQLQASGPDFSDEGTQNSKIWEGARRFSKQLLDQSKEELIKSGKELDSFFKETKKAISSGLSGHSKLKKQCNVTRGGSDEASYTVDNSHLQAARLGLDTASVRILQTGTSTALPVGVRPWLALTMVTGGFKLEIATCPRLSRASLFCRGHMMLLDDLVGKGLG